MSTRDLLLHALVLGLYPLWLLAGLADLACHRASGLARTSGVHESALHLLMLAEIGLAVLVLLVFEPGAGVLAFVAACCLAHAVTGYLDTRWSAPRRRIAPVEQMVHSVLDMAPWIGLGMLLLVAHERLDHPAGWRWRPRDPLPLGLAAGVLAAAMVVVVPALVEFAHAWRLWRRGETPA